MREGLPCFGVHDAERGDLVVEERAGDTAVAVRDVHTSGRVLLRALVEVALEVRGAVLVGVDLRAQKVVSTGPCENGRTTYSLAIQSAELRGDDLEEVLEHVLLLDRLEPVSAFTPTHTTYCTYPAGGTVKRVSGDTKALLELLAKFRLRQIPLIITLECEVMDCVREVVAVAICAEVGHKLVQAVRARAERAAGGKVDVADDLVHAQTAGDVASLGCLLLQLL